MKTRKYFLTLAVVIGILCSFVMGTADLPETNYGAVLIGRAEPALAGMKEFYIDVKPNEDMNISILQNIHNEIENKFVQAGIKIINRPFLDARPKPFNKPELRIDIKTIKLDDSQQYVFHIQTSLSRSVCLTKEQRFFFKAYVWNAEPVMQVVPTQSVHEKITNVVMEQTEAFIHAYRAANPKGTQSTKSDDVSTTPRERTVRAAKPIVAEYRYVASKNSKVFHKLDCSSAKRIKPKNRVFYNSRDEAIQSGRRPCKLCKP